MKKFIFYSIPGHGHTNPTINVGREMVKRGNKVIYYSVPEFKKRIESAGMEYRSYNMERYFDPIIAKNLALFAKKLLELSVSESPILINDAIKEKPDCVVFDSLAMWRKVVGVSLKVPTISLFTTFAVNNKIALAYPKLSLPVLNAFLKTNDSIPAITA